MSDAMKMPEEIAAEIVDRFSWSSNVMRNGRLVGQQCIVAEAIAMAIRQDRAAMAQPIRMTDVRLHVGEGRLSQRSVIEGVNAALRQRAGRLDNGQGVDK